MIIDWTNRVEVHCDKSDLDKLEEGSVWIIEKSEWHTDNQRGQLIMREATSYDDL